MQRLAASPWRRLSPQARRTLTIVMAVLVALVLFLGWFDWRPLTGPFARLASHALHRKVQVGRFSAHLLRWSPELTLDDLRIDNPSWASGPMARIHRITAAIELPELLIGRLVLSQLAFDNARS